MLSQPLSSRLNLAQAVASVNSKTKAISLGMEKETSAEEEGWGQGQPKVKIMGREVKIMKRWGYEWRKGKEEVGKADVPSSPPKKKSAAALKAEKEHKLALLLQALNLLYQSSAQMLSREELDRWAWACDRYVAVRPEVEHGVAGWGGKGQVKLKRTMELRRKG